MVREQVLTELQKMGTEQNRKVYARHGVGANMFGVSFADLKILKKKIKVDHDLALALWQTGNHEACILATMIADPERADEKSLDRWARDLDNYLLTDYFSQWVSRTEFAARKRDAWTYSDEEWIGRAGYGLLGRAALEDATLPDECFEKFLTIIEREIHRSKNRVREAMNGALIAIGMRNEKLQKQAIAAARRIGKVVVDHGETGCKTPDAEAYILKAAARSKKKSKT
jgi:3-methyladenine DNA glycosylase AlkD